MQLLLDSRLIRTSNYCTDDKVDRQMIYFATGAIADSRYLFLSSIKIDAVMGGPRYGIVVTNLRFTLPSFVFVGVLVMNLNSGDM